MALAKDELARRIRSAYERSGKTLVQIGDEMDGTNWRVAQRWVSGINTPRPSKLDKLANVLGVEPEFFQEPQTEHIYDRLERGLDNNSTTLRTALGLLDQILREIRENRDAITAATAQVAGRLDEIETRQAAQDAELNRVQTEFLQALGVPAPPTRANAGEQATNTGSSSTADTQPANGQ